MTHVDPGIDALDPPRMSAQTSRTGVGDHVRTLEDVLSQRRSVRRYGARALSEDDILRLCWAAQGITHPDGYRTAPSAGALYPLELSVATAAGLLRSMTRGFAKSSISRERRTCSI